MNSLVVSNDKGTVNKHNAKANSIISNNKKTTISSNLHLGGENADCSKEDPAEKYGKSRSTLSSMTMAVFLGAWKGGKDFLWAQLQVAVVLTVAYIGNKWPHSYQRNENHNPSMFWVMCGALLVAAAFTWNHEAKVSARGVQLLSRAQTEEWKGWMQWAFIMVCFKIIISLWVMGLLTPALRFSCSDTPFAIHPSGLMHDGSITTIVCTQLTMKSGCLYLLMFGEYWRVVLLQWPVNDGW